MNFNVNYKNFIGCFTDDLAKNTNSPIRYKTDTAINNDLKQALTLMNT